MGSAAVQVELVPDAPRGVPMPMKGVRGTVYERIADAAVESKQLWDLVHARLAHKITWTEFMVKFDVLRADAEELYYEQTSRFHPNYVEDSYSDDEPWEHGGGAS